MTEGSTVSALSYRDVGAAWIVCSLVAGLAFTVAGEHSGEAADPASAAPTVAYARHADPSGPASGADRRVALLRACWPTVTGSAQSTRS
jgi:hypothetical protein